MENEANSTVDEMSSIEISSTQEMTEDISKSSMDNETSSTEISSTQETSSKKIIESTMDNETSTTEISPTPTVMSFDLMESTMNNESEFSWMSDKCGWNITDNSVELDCVINNIRSFNENNYTCNASAISRERLNDSLNICMDERNYLFIIIWCGVLVAYVMGFLTNMCCGEKKSRKKEKV